MIASAKSSLSINIVSEYVVSCSPSAVYAATRKGAVTTPNVSAFVVGGVGPFTYSWSTDNSRVIIGSDSENETRFTCGGSDEDVHATGTVVVTDTGNGNDESSGTVNIAFNFGDTGF